MNVKLPEPLLSVQDVADWLNVKPSWVFDHHGVDGLPSVTVGRHVRFRRGDVEAWLAGQQSTSGSKHTSTEA